MTTSRPSAPGSGPAAPQGEPRDKGLGWGTPALVLGVIAAGTCWLGWPGVGFGLVAAVVGFVGTRRAFHDPHRSGGAALSGLALGVVGLAVGLWIVVPGLLGVGAFGEGLTLDECMAQAGDQFEQRMCATQHLQEYEQRYPGQLQ